MCDRFSLVKKRTGEVFIFLFWSKSLTTPLFLPYIFNNFYKFHWFSCPHNYLTYLFPKFLGAVPGTRTPLNVRFPTFVCVS